MTASTSAMTIEACESAVADRDPGLFDCIEVNLALLADVAHGANTSLRLGDELVVQPRADAEGRWSLEPEPTATVVATASRLGLRCDHVSLTELDAARGAESAADSVLLVIADAFDMPWLPYRSRAHMDHSFLLAGHGPGDAAVVDAYDNRTEWGTAEPGAHRLAWDELPEALHVWRCSATTVAPASGPPSVVVGDVAAYADSLRGSVDRHRAWEQVTLDTWLLARRCRRFARAQHARASMRDAAGAAADHADHLASDAFLGLRRLRRGRPETPAVFDDLDALFTRLTALIGVR